MKDQTPQPAEAEVKKRFDSVLNTVLKVIESCRTEDQLSNAFNWAYSVIYQLGEFYERTGTVAEVRFAHGYKSYVAQKARDVQRATQRDVEALPEIPQGKIVVREVEPHVSVCRSCSGKGVTAHISGRTCSSCNGSGRVKVASTIRTRIQPFDPEREDPRLPVKMD